MKKIICICICIFLIKVAHAQFVFPSTIEREHPRLISQKINKDNIYQTIESSADTKAAYDALKNKISKYVIQYKTDPEWLSSRLQMYWESHATEVYLDGEYYSHAKGHAPVPTVRFTGQRDYVSDYGTPSFEDIKPYSEDERGVYLYNNKTNTWEWVHPSKTGRAIENINERIMRVARDAALVYFVEGDEDYAKFATHIFDVYMNGLYYRSEPIDMQKGNTQDITGITSFQVIKENIVDELSESFDFLYDYLQANKKKELPIYTASLKKLAEIIIKNGVPDNNWNLHQANFVIQIALVLDNNEAYPDGKGCQYYLNRVFNETERKQWSVKDVLNYGYDQDNGVWNECSGYALSVAKGYTHLARVIQEALGEDILPSMAIIPKSVAIMPQYLYPNKYIVAYGDSHYSKLETQPFLDLVSNAQRFNKREQEVEFTSLIYMLEGKKAADSKGNPKYALSVLLYDSEIKLDKTIQAANPSDYITNSFYAPNVSWVAMRNGFNEKHGLMISQTGSFGNHMHSNGIAMELYGKGHILAPEGGRGSSYFQPDYNEYYSQFPAHNTVSVNGKSQYLIMQSYYAFEVKALYPKSEQKTGYYPNINFSDIYFHEPSTDSDQNRVMSIVRTGETSGYYIDIFRSRQKAGQDEFHDYFYRNLGQELDFKLSNNSTLDLKSSSKLNSKSGNIIAYDYFKEEASIKTNQTFTAIYNLNIKGNEEVSMNMWVQGNNNRELFKVHAPPSAAFRGGLLPKDVEEADQLTTVVRQYGEAWDNPFVVVYEPSSTSEPKTIKHIVPFKSETNANNFVGLKIESKSNRIDYLFSSDKMDVFTYKNMIVEATYGLVTKEQGETTLFLGSGKRMESNGYSLEVLGKNTSTATLVFGKTLQFTCEDTMLLTVPDTYGEGKLVLHVDFQQLKGKRLTINGKKVVQFMVPPMDFQDVSISL